MDPVDCSNASRVAKSRSRYHHGPVSFQVLDRAREGLYGLGYDEEQSERHAREIRRHKRQRGLWRQGHVVVLLLDPEAKDNE